MSRTFDVMSKIERFRKILDAHRFGTICMESWPFEPIPVPQGFPPYFDIVGQTIEHHPMGTGDVFGGVLYTSTSAGTRVEVSYYGWDPHTKQLGDQALWMTDVRDIDFCSETFISILGRRTLTGPDGVVNVSLVPWRPALIF